MPTSRKPEVVRPLSEVFLAPRGRFQRYRWLVFAVAAVLEVALVLVFYFAEAHVHPLSPLGAGLVSISVLAAGLGGVLVGAASALVGVVTAFLLVAELDSAAGIANAAASAVVWCGVAVATGLVVGYLRRQVTRRQAALEQALGRSVAAKQQLERVLEFTPNFHMGESLAEVCRAVCESAVETFGADGARVYAIKGDVMEIIALTDPTETIRPGFELSVSDFTDLESMLVDHRPRFVRDISGTGVKGPALEVQDAFHIVSTVRIPIASPSQAVGLLALGWSHPVERPSDELMAIMQRFGDQAGIAWQNALRAQAQKQADILHETLERVVALAPTFHITGTRQEVAKAICEAAVMTFGCKGASLYRVDGDRMTVLDCIPALDTLPPGRTFSLTGDMPLARELRSSTPTFVPDLGDPSRAARPWPPDVMDKIGTRSALYVPLRFDERGPQNLLVLNWNEQHEAPDASFLAIVERFADQVALALSNASAERLHARLEASLLPTTPVDHPLVEVITRYRTGEQRLRLGGDFVGTVVVGEHHLGFIIGDVSGHGPDAAALGATLRSTWKALVLAGQSIVQSVDVMRRMLLLERAESNVFATIIAGHIDLENQTLDMVNAGHLPPFLIADTVTSLDSRPVPPLGIGAEGAWPRSSFSLPERWSLLLYTDGLIDIRLAPGSPERYGEERLRERLGTWTTRKPDAAALDSLMNEIETASGGHFGDDVAILLFVAKDRPRDRES